MGRAPPIVAAALIGVLAGGLSGLFGVGGGILIVPGLVLLLWMEQRTAHATSLAAIVPIAVAGAVGFALDDAIDWPAAAAIAAGSVGGAVAGAGFLRRTPERALRLGFAIVLALTAVGLFVHPSGDGRGVMSVGLAAGLLALGILAGVLAGLFGVGGGVIVVPALVLIWGVPDVIAKGTSLAVIVPTALAGSLRNARGGLVRFDIAASVGVLGIIAAFVAARLALGLTPVVSSALFAVLLLGIAVRLVTQTPSRSARRSSSQRS